MKYCITNGKVILKNQVVDANVYVENTKITEISNRQPDDETVIDAKVDMCHQDLLMFILMGVVAVIQCITLLKILIQLQVLP